MPDGTPRLLAVLFPFLVSTAGAGPSPDLDELSGEAERLIGEFEVPSLVLAAVVDGEIRGAGVAGVRKWGEAEPVKVEIGDRFHIGSLTKSFTATVAATLVEEERIRWDTRCLETLDLDRVHEGYDALTLEHLLCHQGGFPVDAPSHIWKKTMMWRSVKSSRFDFSSDLLGRKPAYPPGTAFVYSNLGYSVAGSMMDSLTRETVESMIANRIFVPLKMTTAGFGAPAMDPRNPSKVRDEPWGHYASGTPVNPTRSGDNRPAIAPASSIHCSILDLAIYARYHLLRQPAPILRNVDSITYLHTPRINGYALGWSTEKLQWAGGIVLNHYGSNDNFSALIWIAPAKNFAAVTASNIGGEKGKKACSKAITTLIRRYGVR